MRAEQLHESFYNKSLSFISFFASNKKLTIHRKTQFTLSFLFMLKSQQKVDIKLSKICQAIKNLASEKRSLHASLKLFTNLTKMSASFQAICRPLGFSKTRDNRETTEQFILLHTRYVCDFSGSTNFSQNL